MHTRTWAHAVATLAAAACAVAAPSAAGATSAATPEAAARGYLEARAAAATAADPGAVLSEWLVPAGSLVTDETLLARGAARSAAQLGHAIESVTCQVGDLVVARSARGDSATVTAHVITTTGWRAASGLLDTEASGVDHTLVMRLIDGSWRVATDAYVDVLRPSHLEAAGASAARVKSASRALERSAKAFPQPRIRTAASPAPPRRCRDVITYDRPAARAYADRYALTYNRACVRFGADCANFASQSARAGGMLRTPGRADSGWWYDENGTSSPGNDTYSLSWINVTRQMSSWNERRTEWAGSAGLLSRGDFIFYDWTSDGTWDHVAVVAGTNNAGQKVIDAHTTDHYHVFWKLGSSSARYRFAKVRARWVA